jgi:NAD(P)-dependent dehydrogenase (short-subunit alcohol dehydrogenase family)
MHSLAWGSLKPLAGAEQAISRKQLEIAADAMGHSLVYWVQDCLRAGLFEWGGRIVAMTSSGGTRAIPNHGSVSSAKAILEAHIRQLALELAPAGITANAIPVRHRNPRAEADSGTREDRRDRQTTRSAQAPHHARRRGPLHRRAVPSGHVLAHREHAPSGWRRKHRRMIAWKRIASLASICWPPLPAFCAA